MRNYLISGRIGKANLSLLHPIAKGLSEGPDTLTLSSNHFGTIVVPLEKVLFFPSGLIGFPDMRRFVLLDLAHKEKDTPFISLQSLDEQGLSFIVIDPLLIKPDYRISVMEDEILEIGKAEAKDLVILTILTIGKDNLARITANLRSPLIVNPTTRKGKQVILQEESYPIRYPVVKNP